MSERLEECEPGPESLAVTVTFEQGFSDVQRAASAASKVIAGLGTAMKQLSKAASGGDILQARKASERLGAILESTRQEVSNARSAWPFSPEAEEAYLREVYSADLIKAASAENIQIQQRDEGLVVFPSIVRILPSERAVRVNRKKVQSVRPSHVIKILKAIQVRKPKAAPEAFLEVLHRAYLLLTAREYGKTVALSAVYEALTLLPGSTGSYDQTDFVRDLFLLDRNGVTKTKSGAVCSLPASTGTKGTRGTFSFVAPDGEAVTYYGIKFSGVPA